jgi:hypothetical protein
MSNNYNTLDTTSVKVAHVVEEVKPVVVDVDVDVDVEQEAVEKVLQEETVIIHTIAPVLVVQRPVLYFLERLVRPF